jgi:hypothetical protein
MPRERLESAQAREVDYYFFASFFRLAAQYAFMRWDCALRAAADLPLWFFAGVATGAGTARRGFFGGRPRLFMGPRRQVRLCVIT